MIGDYKIGGGWGARIGWTRPEQFKTEDEYIDDKTLFDVDGHYTPRPKKGQTLIGEFQNSWMQFEFVEIDYMSNPPDMFFAKVKPIDQETK